MSVVTCCVYLLTVAVINLQQDTYSVAECDGSVAVCVILSSALDRNVSVTLTTADFTAQGQLQQLFDKEALPHSVPAGSSS